MTGFSVEGLVGNGRIGPQTLSFRQGRWVLDTSDYIRIDGDGLLVCPLDDVFDQPRNPVIIFGTPNVSMIVPEIDGAWKRFAAYMFWRKASHWGSTRTEDDYVTQGRVQAGIWCEVLGLPVEAKGRLNAALASLLDTKKVSCAHTIALALHRAGFRTGNGKSLRWVVRPTRLARILWTEGLSYRGASISLRWIQAGPKSVSDHFVGAWLSERSSPQRAVQKQYYPTASTGRAPTFPPREETISLQDLWGNTDEPRVRVGISVPTKTGANLAYALGQQPIFVVEIPSQHQLDRVGPALKPFAGKLDRVTWLKKNILFRRMVVNVIRHNLMRRIDWVGEVPVSSVAQMLKLSPNPEHDGAFIYNYVATAQYLFLSRLTNGTSRTDLLGQLRGRLLDRLNKFIEWVMAKHVLIAGYDMSVFLSGELWSYRQDNDVTVRINRNSGTYRPDVVRLITGVKILKEAFPVPIETMPLSDD
jgi:hypothetical protein